MLKQKRTKFSKMRGSNSHGGGFKKRGRGAGSRGGVGKAGSGARGDTLKPTILKKYGKNYFGKLGFKSMAKKNQKTISLNFISENIDKLIERKVITKTDENYIFDVTKIKIDKVLGRGNFNLKLKITTFEISKGAKKIIEDLKGEVILKKRRKEQIKKEEKLPSK